MAIWSFINIGSADRYQFYFSSNVRDIHYNRFLMIYDTDRAVSRVLEGRRVRYWFDKTEPLTGVYVGSTGLRLWLTSLVGWEFPSRALFWGTGDNPLVVNETIVIPTIHGQDMIYEANKSLAPFSQHLELVSTSQIARGSERFELLITKVRAGAADLNDDGFGAPIALSLSDFKALPQFGTVVHNESTVTVTTASQQWAYAAAFAIPDQYRTPGKRARIQLDVEVKAGTVSFGPLVLDGSAFTSEIPASSGSHQVILKVPDMSQVKHVIVRNYDRVPAEVTISNIEIRMAR
jgi:hypothetical protein